MRILILSAPVSVRRSEVIKTPDDVGAGPFNGEREFDAPCTVVGCRLGRGKNTVVDLLKGPLIGDARLVAVGIFGAVLTLILGRVGRFRSSTVTRADSAVAVHSSADHSSEGTVFAIPAEATVIDSF